MNSPKRILVYSPVEDEKLRAVRQAVSLAGANKASITVLRVLDGGTHKRLRNQLKGASGSADLATLVKQDQQEELETLLSQIETGDLDINVEIRWGTHWLELIRFVLDGGYDLVLKAASGAEARRKPFFGSTALHLIRKCPCPVWLVGEVWNASDGRVLAAVDPGEDETRQAHANSILEWALSLAGDTGEIHAVSAWGAWGERLLRGRMNADELAVYIKSCEDEARGGLEKALASVGSPLDSDCVHLMKGDPRSVIPQFVEDLGIDLVVMGSVGRVGIAGLLIGETAETLLRSVRTSVFVVKPPGFVCPVKLPADRT